MKYALLIYDVLGGYLASGAGRRHRARRSSSVAAIDSRDRGVSRGSPVRVPVGPQVYG